MNEIETQVTFIIIWANAKAFLHILAIIFYGFKMKNALIWHEGDRWDGKKLTFLADFKILRNR